jgi:hypothetical protein
MWWARIAQLVQQQDTAGLQRCPDSIPGRGTRKRFTSFYNVHTGDGAHPTSYSIGTVAHTPGVKWLEREADDLPPSSAEIKDEWIYNSSPPWHPHGVFSITLQLMWHAPSASNLSSVHSYTDAAEMDFSVFSVRHNCYNGHSWDTVWLAILRRFWFKSEQLPLDKYPTSKLTPLYSLWCIITFT